MVGTRLGRGSEPCSARSRAPPATMGSPRGDVASMGHSMGQMITCAFCGKKATAAVRPQGGGPPKKYCSADCSVRFRNGTLARRKVKCRHCGQAFVSAKRRALFCSYGCLNLHRRKPAKSMSCVICSRAVPPKAPGTVGVQSIFCSGACRRVDAARRAKARARERRAHGLCVRCGAPTVGVQQKPRKSEPPAHGERPMVLHCTDGVRASGRCARRSSRHALRLGEPALCCESGCAA